MELYNCMYMYFALCFVCPSQHNYVHFMPTTGNRCAGEWTDAEFGPLDSKHNDHWEVSYSAYLM